MNVETETVSFSTLAMACSCLIVDWKGQGQQRNVGDTLEIVIEASEKLF